MRRVSAALVHHPVLDRQGAVVTTAITNLDLHDIARSVHTYGLEALYIVLLAWLATAGPGITINAGATDVVNLRGLTIDGANYGTVGILFVSGKSLTMTFYAGKIIKHAMMSNPTLMMRRFAGTSHRWNTPDLSSCISTPSALR